MLLENLFKRLCTAFPKWLSFCFLCFKYPDLGICGLCCECDTLPAHPSPLWTADGNESSSSSKCFTQLSSRADINQHSNLALMDRILTFHKIRDTGCSGDNKIQIGLFQRATQSCLCAWVTWQTICQYSFCVFPSWFLVQFAKGVKLCGPQKPGAKEEQDKRRTTLF